MISRDTLIYDLETKTFGSPNSRKDIPKVFGFYSYKTDKYYVRRNPEDFRLALEKHKYIVTYNGLGYDNVVLHHNGFNEETMYNEPHNEARLKYKYDIDLYNIISDHTTGKDRANIIKIKKGILKDLLMETNLDFVAKTLGLVDEDTGKKEIDYDWLKDDKLIEEHWDEIREYTIRDLELTRKLYEWMEDYFDPFKHYLSDESIEKKHYLTTSVASYVYKVFCRRLGVPETYSNAEHEDYGGGYVSYPSVEYISGKLYCLDFNSLYPSIFHQCNLSARHNTGWHGNGAFEVIGYYDDSKLSDASKILREFYEERLEFKRKKDPKEYTVKIIINTFYGIFGNPAFEQFFDSISAGDCTRLGRQWVKYARRVFRENGYNVVYTDTDSVYLEDVFDNEQKLLDIKDVIVQHIKDNVPFPYEHFDMGIDDEISHMFFFKGDTKDKDTDSEMDEQDFIDKPKGFLKKNYIYITTDGDVKYKNLGVKKKSTSLLTRTIFKNILIPKIKQEKCVKWPRSFFEELIPNLIRENPKLVAKRFKLKSPAEYASKTCQQYNLACEFGAGIKFLVKNTAYGVGKGVKYAIIDDFITGKIKYSDLDLSTIWSELGYFIETEKCGLERWF